MHLNHSCEPNLGLQGQIVYVALRDIAIGEELTFDYAMNDDDPDEIMKCECGTPSCRGVVTGADWKNPEIQRKYDGYFLVYTEEDRRREKLVAAIISTIRGLSRRYVTTA